MVQINLFANRNRLTNIEKRLEVAKGEWSVGGEDWDFRISRYKLLYFIGRIDNKVLPYSTGNSIQSPVINHNGKEHKNKDRLYVYN